LDIYSQKIINGDQTMIIVLDEIKCPKCNQVMSRMQACHLICKNCGAHLDCSDKGSYW